MSEKWATHPDFPDHVVLQSDVDAGKRIGWAADPAVHQQKYCQIIASPRTADVAQRIVSDHNRIEQLKATIARVRELPEGWRNDANSHDALWPLDDAADQLEAALQTEETP